MVARKKKIKARPRTGLAAVDPTKGFVHVLSHFHMDVDKKTLTSICKDWVKKTYNKSDAAAILANPEYHFTAYTHRAATIWYVDQGGQFEENQLSYRDSLKSRFDELISTGKEILKDKKEKANEKSNVIVLSPQERLRIKINKTVLMELEDLQDSWIEGEKPELDLYQRFQYHGLTGAAVQPCRDVIEGWLLDYTDAYHKRCEQAVEGYSHLKRTEINRRIKHCEAMLADLDKVKSAAKARRKTKLPKTRTADKQVARLSYLKEDKNYKLVSVAATSIPGATRLYTFNVKNKILTEYVTSSPKGFQVSGSTLKDVDIDISRCVTLRKPDDFIPTIVNKTIKQIDVAWKGLTTKTRKPAPRINKDTLLLRTI